MDKDIIINKNNKFFLLSILLMTAGDAFVSLAPFHLLFRAAIYSIFFFIVLYKRFINIPCILGAILLISSLILHLVMDPASIKINARPAVNIIHPFILYIIFSNIANQQEIFSKENLILFFRISYYAIILSLVLGKITGLGQTIGARGAISGIGGFFKGMNEIGILMVIMVTINYYLKDTLPKKEQHIMLIFFVILGALIFTKSSLVAMLMAFFILFAESKSFRILTSTGIVLIVIIYLDKMTSFVNFLFNETFFKAIKSGLLAFIFRGRDTFVEAFFKDLTFSFTSKLELFFIGYGNHFISKQLIRNMFHDATMKDFEMDYLDLFFGFGVLFTVFYTTYVVLFLKKIYKYSNRLVAIGFFLIFCHAVLAGHVLFSTQIMNVSIVFLFFIKNIYITQNSKELLC